MTTPAVKNLPPALPLITVEHRAIIELPLRRMGWRWWLTIVPGAIGFFFTFAILSVGLYIFGPVAGVSLPLCALIAAAILLIVLTLSRHSWRYALPSRTTIELDHTHLIATEFLLGLPRRRRWPINSIRGLHVGPVTQELDPFLPVTRHENWLAIKLELSSGPPSVIAAGYPEALLASAAAELASRFPLSSPESVLNLSAQPPAPPCVRIETAAAVAGATDIVPPLGSHARAVRDATTTTIILPPPGFRGLPGTTAGLGAAMIGFGGFLAMLAPQADPAQAEKTWLIFASAAAIAAAGIILTLCGWHLARRKIVFIASPVSLVFSLIGPLRRREFEWPKTLIKAVRVGPSNVEVNRRHLPELQIHFHTGKIKGMLVGRDPAELQWLAALLHPPT